MADEYSKYKLFRKYKTEDGVNYTPLDEYQALYESGDGVDCSCGYRKYKWDSGNDTKSTILNSDTDRTIPMQTFRIDATYPNNSGNYFIRFTTTPDTDTTSNKGFSICPDEGTIWDNGERKYITAQTKIYDNIYEYTFSVPVYFSNGEVNAPYEQVTAVTYNCEYMCGSVIIGNIPTLTINSVQGNWTREGNTFTSNTINHNENTIERIYFSVSSPTAVTFTIDQSSENQYDFLIISKLDSGVTNSTSTDSSSPNYAHWYNGRTGSISMTISDTEEHFVELMYRKDGSGSSGRDNVIVTLEIKLDYDILSEYEVWREYEYCPNDDTIESLPTGNIEYRNPQKSCGCGYREYKYVSDGTWICNRYIEETDNEQYYGKENTEPNLIITKYEISSPTIIAEGNGAFKVYYFPSYWSTTLKVYFKLNKSGTINVTGTSKYRWFYYLSFLDKPLSEGEYVASSDISDNSVSYTINDTEEHFIELKYENEGSSSSWFGGVGNIVFSYVDDFQQYEVWKEYEYCPYSDGYDVYTGNVDYRNPTQCCECGYREYEWESNSGKYVCGSDITKGLGKITKIEGKWNVIGNVIHKPTTMEYDISKVRVYFRLYKPGVLYINVIDTPTADYYYNSALMFSSLDREITDYTVKERPYYPNYLYYFVDDTEEHFFEIYVAARSKYDSAKVELIDMYNNLFNYEEIKEYEYCPDDKENTLIPNGNIDYINPSLSCKCGYREYKWVFSGEEYVCGSDIDSNIESMIPLDEIPTNILFNKLKVSTEKISGGSYFRMLNATKNKLETFSVSQGLLYNRTNDELVTIDYYDFDNTLIYNLNDEYYFYDSEDISVISAITNNYGLYYKYEVWREYEYCPDDDTIEPIPTGKINYRKPTYVGNEWVMTTQSKLGSELGEGYEQDKRYVLYESYSLCNGELIETEWRESNLVFKTEIEEKYIKYEANETYILMGSTVGDIIAHIPVSKYCCESTITGCKQYCYNLYSISTIDKDGNQTQIYSGRMDGGQVTLRDNENYSYRLYFGDYCGSGRNNAYFTYTLKDEDYHYYMCAVTYQKNDYEDDTKWVEIGYTPRYPSNK